jgi:L-threonylcarbamoyladenylate synthase
MDIEYAATLIKKGDIVAFPTETVYGLGADATNQDACLKIYKLKARPAVNPLIVHVSSIEEARSVGVFNEMAERLTEVFWPGPLTIVLPLKSHLNIAKCVTAGLTTIALRMPSV